MALKSVSPSSPPNGVVDNIPSRSAPEPDEDLEDGEIFDEDDDDVAPPVHNALTPSQAVPNESLATMVQQMQQHVGGGGGGTKRRNSPMDRGRGRSPRNPKRPKRTREDERGFALKKRHRSDDEKSKDCDEEENMGRDLSPPNHRDWERFRSDDEDNESADGPGGDRGGSAGRRGRREFPRPRRGTVRGGRGGGRRIPNSRRDNKSLCKFFLQGNCQRANDCPFSHQIHPRKYEMCKFYMNDCCVKMDKCNFMHEEFPCKFHHLGLKCYAGKRCKFSHNKVTPYIKQMLLKHNQVDSDKHFLQHLQTTESRSPTPPDYSDYDTPQGTINYVTITRKHGSNSEDFTVDDIELTSDQELQQRHEMGGDGHSDRSNRRRTRHGVKGGRSRGGGHQVSPHRGSDSQESHQNEYREHRGDRDYRSHPSGPISRGPPSFDEPHSDEGESRTPMPSPSQNSNEREGDEGSRDERPSTPPPPSMRFSSRRHHSATPSPPPPREPTHSAPTSTVHISDLPESELTIDVPSNLPKKQRELFLRVQKQQREADDIEDKDRDNEKEDEFREDNWYSSDEEGGGGPLAAILKKIKSKPSSSSGARQQPSVPNVASALPDIDVSAVSRLLSSVRETIEQKTNSQMPKEPEAETSKPDNKRRRDPRLLRGDSSPPSSTQVQMNLPPLDVDLRVQTSGQLTADVDLRQLPFKPVPMHQAAREIDASTTSNPPIHWVLLKFPQPPKPDYSQVQSKNTLDPRLKKYESAGRMASSMPLSPRNQPTMSGSNNFVVPPQYGPPAGSQPHGGGSGGMLPPQQHHQQPFQPSPGQQPFQPSPGQQPFQQPPQQQQPPAGRDPRQRNLVSNDPRRKPTGFLLPNPGQHPGGPPHQQHLPPHMLPPPHLHHQHGHPGGPHGPFPPNQGAPMMFPSHGRPPPPGMPMYPMRGDSDLRNAPGMSFHPSDVDLRYQQTSSHHHFP